MEAVRSPRFAPEPAFPSELEDFTAGLHGSVVLPGDAEYDEARQVHSAQYDRRPAAIVRAADVDDVVHTVRFAREARLPFSVRGGRHSLAGFGVNDGGIVLDLGAMKGLHIDPVARTAWAQPGLTAGEYTIAAAAHGLATPFGDTASVGIGGLTLGGGIGWLVRKYGMTIDSLLAVEVVTADGRVLTASPESHPDLFWAVRGGGGNFGVVTRFQFRLHPVGTILGGALFLPATPEVLRNLVPTAQAAPEELTTITMVMRIPPMPFVPAEQVGRLSAIVMFVWAGEPGDGQAALDPFRRLGTPLAEAVMPMPYPGIYQMLAEAEKRAYGTHRSRFLERIDDAAVEAILDAMAAPSSPMAMIQIRVLGGATARVPADATAFAHRDAPVMLLVITPYEDPSTEPVHVAWTVALHDALAANDAGVYSNFLEVEGDARIRAAYPNGAYER
ncbi:MAG TPA: FAD-binding oxidoreductase, partial [Candidatus Limnocylindrales bacterium]